MPWRRLQVFRTQRRSALGFILLLAAGCGAPGGRAPGHDPATRAADQWPGELGLTVERPACDPAPGPVADGGHFRVGLVDTVLPGHAPVPRNRAERLVFAQLYETLVNVDCAGHLQPGLAEHWSCTQDSTVWVFTLRPDVRFWDGTRLNAADVKQSWCDSQGLAASGRGCSPFAWLNARAQTVSVVDATRLAIRLPEPQARFPLLLAHPATAVAVRRDGWTWPVGSGPCRLRAATPAPRPELECRPNPQHPARPAWQTLTFTILPGGDPRDLAGADIDLTVLRDLEAVSFFTDLPGFAAVALPWDRLYLLICPPEADPGGTIPWMQTAARLDPRTDLLQVSARAWSEPVFPAASGADCPQLTGPVTVEASARLDWDLAGRGLDAAALVYCERDPAARELALRLTALAPAPVRAVGLPRSALDFTLEWQMAGACLLAVDQDFPTGCLQLAGLLGRAAWLQQTVFPGAAEPGPQVRDSLGRAQGLTAGGGDPLDRLTRSGLLHPLALTRPWLVLREPLAGIRLAYDGTPLLGGLGRPEPAEAP